MKNKSLIFTIAALVALSGSFGTVDAMRRGGGMRGGMGRGIGRAAGGRMGGRVGRAARSWRGGRRHHDGWYGGRWRRHGLGWGFGRPWRRVCPYWDPYCDYYDGYGGNGFSIGFSV